MGDLSTPPRRSYNSPTRRQRAAETRERIVTAGAELAREFTTWEWEDLTFRAVAERAGVSERTVYRNFPSERLLHDAVMARLEDDAGVNYDAVTLGNVADVTARVFGSLGRFAIEDSARAPGDPTFAGADARRQDALMAAVSAQVSHWNDTHRRAAAGLLDVLWSPTTYERLVRAWKLADADATAAVQWLMGKVIEALDNNDSPGDL